MNIVSELSLFNSFNASYFKLYLESLSSYLERHSIYIDNSFVMLWIFSAIFALYFGYGMPWAPQGSAWGHGSLGKYRVIYKKNNPLYGGKNCNILRIISVIGGLLSGI
jgi:hypothetical protein